MVISQLIPLCKKQILINPLTQRKSIMKKLFVLFVVLIVVLVSCVNPEKKACTQEAKICPDGTVVGRTGPNCEFASCNQQPTQNEKEIAGKANNAQVQTSGNNVIPIGVPSSGTPVPPGNQQPPGNPGFSNPPGMAGGGGPVLPPIPKKPNIIVIMTDDQSADTTIYMNKTVALLANNGVVFDNNFVSNPLCCPSRSTLLTGQYSHNNGVFFNADKSFNGITYGGGYYALAPTLNNTLPVWMQKAGYETAIVGKFLNGYAGTAPAPGWDKKFIWIEPYAYYNYSVNEDGTIINFGDTPSDYLTDVLSNKASSFIKNQAGTGKPFFLYLTPIAPHELSTPDPSQIIIRGPTPAQRHIGKFSQIVFPCKPSFNEKDVSDKPSFIRNNITLLNTNDMALDNQLYHQRIESLLAVDDMVEQIVNTLQETSQLNNTIIIFTSDNGYFLGEHRILEGKMFGYDEAIKVPLIIYGQGIAQGEKRSQLVSNVDITSTILSLASATPERTLDGHSLVPLLTSTKTNWRTGFLIQGGDKTPGDTYLYGMYRGIRTQSYAYLEHELVGGSIETELYDLRTDPWELENKYNDPKYQMVINNLRNRLTELRSCSGTSCWDTTTEPEGPSPESPSSNGKYSWQSSSSNPSVNNTDPPNSCSPNFTTQNNFNQKSIIIDQSNACVQRCNHNTNCILDCYGIV